MVDRYLPRDEELPINHLDSPTVGLRICFVTPFAWSQPHEVNTHVAGTAAALRRLGHEVTVLAPSSRARDLLAGRRALHRGTAAEVIAVGPSIPISRRSSMGVPVGVRANLTLALARGHYDVVHGFEPGLPSLSYLALTSTHALTAATFFSPDRLSYPPRRRRGGRRGREGRRRPGRAARLRRRVARTRRRGRPASSGCTELRPRRTGA